MSKDNQENDTNPPEDYGWLMETPKKARLRDREARLKQLEIKKRTNLCHICRKKARWSNGKWVSIKPKKMPNKKNNNQVYHQFINEFRNSELYKDLKYAEFLKRSREHYKEWKAGLEDND